MKPISIGIFAYPECSKTAVYGCEEMFLMANDVAKMLGEGRRFSCQILQWPIEIEQSESFDAIILPPSRANHFAHSPPETLTNWLIQQHQKGSILASACVGVFILAGAGLLKDKIVTTHWCLADKLKQDYPNITVRSDEILINQGDIITAGGMMAWVDLGLELIAQFSSQQVMRLTGKQLVVDTGTREQKYYQAFSPNFQHGDASVVALQHYLHHHFQEPIHLATLAAQANLTERTIQRRFLKHLQTTPLQYLQRVRIQYACDLLESSTSPFDRIAHQVGYDDVSGCRKVFTKLMGLSPSDFRKRFGR